MDARWLPDLFLIRTERREVRGNRQRRGGGPETAQTRLVRPLLIGQRILLGGTKPFGQELDGDEARLASPATAGAPSQAT